MLGAHVLIVTTTHHSTRSRLQEPPHYSAQLVDMQGEPLHTLAEGVHEQPVYRAANEWASRLGFTLHERTDEIHEELRRGEVRPA